MFFKPSEDNFIVFILLLFASKSEQKPGWLSAAPQVEVGEFYCRHFARLQTFDNFRTLAQRITTRGGMFSLRLVSLIADTTV